MRSLLGPGDVDSVDGYDAAARRLTFKVAHPDLSGVPRQFRRSAVLVSGAVTIGAEDDEPSRPGELEDFLRTFLVAANAIEPDERPTLERLVELMEPYTYGHPTWRRRWSWTGPEGAPPNWDEDSGLWEHQGTALTVRRLRMALGLADPPFGDF